MWHRVVDCVGVGIEITSRVDPLDAALDNVLATYAASNAPQLRYELTVNEWPELLRDGTRVGRYDEAVDLVPALERDLNTQVTARAAGVLVHACAIAGRDGSALVFAGRSGGGKSTLIRELLDRGFSYITEECVALDADGACRGLARPLHADEAATRAPRGFAVKPYTIRRADGEHQTRVFHPPPERIHRQDARVRAIVVIDHAPDAPGTLEPLAVAPMLLAVWPLVFRADDAALRDLPIALAEIARYRLVTSTPASALEHALALAEELGVAPA
jgi:hypothetical protein